MIRALAFLLFLKNFLLMFSVIYNAFKFVHDVIHRQFEMSASWRYAFRKVFNIKTLWLHFVTIFIIIGTTIGVSYYKLESEFDLLIFAIVVVSALCIYITGLKFMSSYYDLMQRDRNNRNNENDVMNYVKPKVLMPGDKYVSSIKDLYD